MKTQNSQNQVSEDTSVSGQAASSSSARSASTSAGANSNRAQARTSWSGGSWRGKAVAVAEIARESISGNTAAEIATRTGSALRSPSQRLSKSLNSPGKSNPSPASATPLHVTSDASSDDKGEESSEKKMPEPKENAGGNEKNMSRDKAATDTAKDGSADEQSSQERPLPATGWRGWWYRPKQEPFEGEKDSRPPDMGKLHVTTNDEGAPAQESTNTVPTTDSPVRSSGQNQSSQDAKDGKPQRSSWFGLWGSGTPTDGNAVSDSKRPSVHKAESVEASSTNVDAAADPSKSPTQSARAQLTSRPASGSWAFWSRERPKAEEPSDAKTSEAKKEVGELAISGTESQSKPRPAQLSQGDAASVAEGSKKRQRPTSSELQPSSSKKKNASTHASNESQSDSDVPPAMQQSILRTTIEPPKAKSKQRSQEKVKLPSPNAILPLFQDTYPTSQPASYLSRLSRYIPYGSSISRPKHLTRSQQPHRIRKALAIGVHGYFPTPLIQKVLGPPTGTSIKFADSAAAAVQQYCALHAYTANIEKVALEGEGTVEQRIESLWKLLLNWIDAIQHSDFILVACHSQGVPVAVGLLARLLGFGCISKDARIGICAMAGVNLGPFASYQSRFLPVGSSGAELFQFAQPNSSVSLAYTNALNTCLRHHVRILYVGSLDDQLVSLESSTFGTASHPYISRAVFVDGREHPQQNDFLTRLVGFALRLRNLGISDHGLVRELSGPLAGSLYTGEGHSRIYEEDGVYDLAVRLAAETDTLDGHTNPHLEINKKAQEAGEANPYFLPWALRGMLEEEEVKKQMTSETEELLGCFEVWRPQSKSLRDVRFRLEAVRSKL